MSVLTPEVIPPLTPEKPVRWQRVHDTMHEISGVHSVLGLRGSFEYLRRKGEHRDYPLEVRHKKVKYPLALTSALCDILNVQEVLEDDCYDFKPSRSIVGQPIIDIGSFIGISAAHFASRYPESPVFAFEPLGRNYDLLQRNAAPYSGQIVARQLAVLAEAGPVSPLADLRRHPYMPLFSSEHSAGQNDNWAISPDELLNMAGIEGGIGILKVDIEGGEASLFAHPSIGSLLARSQVLMIETHDQFVAGSAEAVDRAALQNGLELTGQNAHDVKVYQRL